MQELEQKLLVLLLPEDPLDKRKLCWKSEPALAATRLDLGGRHCANILKVLHETQGQANQVNFFFFFFLLEIRAGTSGGESSISAGETWRTRIYVLYILNYYICAESM
jgi:protein subunit release factor A